jgi:hypothetical protein
LKEWAKRTKLTAEQVRRGEINQEFTDELMKQLEDLGLIMPIVLADDSNIIVEVHPVAAKEGTSGPTQEGDSSEEEDPPPAPKGTPFTMQQGAAEDSLPGPTQEVVSQEEDKKMPAIALEDDSKSREDTLHYTG